MDARKIDYEVTEKAGAWVAGRRSPGPGKTIPLTEEEAYFAVLAGELKAPGAKGPKPGKAKKAETPVEPEA